MGESSARTGVRPAAGCGARSSPSAQIIAVRRARAPAWCAAATGTGTVRTKVETPRANWATAMSGTRSTAARARGRQGRSAGCRRRDNAPASVAAPRTRWTNCTTEGSVTKRTTHSACSVRALDGDPKLVEGVDIGGRHRGG